MRRWLSRLWPRRVEVPRPFDWDGPGIEDERMSVYDLYRMAEGPGYTLGRIEDSQNVQLCVTAERAWVDKNGNGLGDTNESRIPAGTYICKRDLHNKTSSNPYEVWEVLGVPGRSEIHIHIGNDPRIHSKGCPLVGTDFGPKGTVTRSRDAFDKWMKATAAFSQITLRVHDVPPKAA